MAKPENESTPLGAARAFSASLLAALVVGGAEALVLASTTELFEDGVGQGLLGVSYILGLAGLPGLALGLFLALWLPGVHAEWAPLLAPGRASDTSAATHLSVATRLATLLTVATLPVLAVYLFGVESRRFTRVSLVGPYLALVAGAGLALGGLIYAPVRRGLGWLLSRLAPHGRLWGLPLTLALLIALVGTSTLSLAYILRDAELAVFDFRPLMAAAGMVLLALILAMSRLPLGSPRSRVMGFVLLAVLALGAVFGLEPTDGAARVLPRTGYLSRIALVGLRRAFDFDRDGYSALLGGGDCDESDPTIGPHARDVPGNGLDENCFGGDALGLDPADAGARERPPLVEPRRLSIVVLMIDTVRPDHLGVYGYDRGTSPAIDAWAEDAFVFGNARAQSPTTSRSLPSVMTGRYPSRVDWTDRFAAVSDLGEENSLLFEIFQEAGWQTETVTSHWYFDLAPAMRRGVERWDNEGAAALGRASRESKAPEISRRLLERLESLAATPSSEPFLVFAHYFDPHSEYMPHPEVRDFGSGLAAEYDSEIAFVDLHLGPVLERLGADDLASRTAVVIFSDHGEALREHGLRYHGHTLFEEEIRVPLMIRIPGLSPRRVENDVALIDILPTLTELSGLSAPDAQGRSLLPLMLERGTWPERFIFAEHFPTPWHRFHLSAVVGPDGRKLIRDQTQNVTMLFDLREDPLERHSLELGESEREDELLRALGAFVDADPGAAEFQRTRGR